MSSFAFNGIDDMDTEVPDFCLEQNKRIKTTSWHLQYVVSPVSKAPFTGIN